MPKIEAQLRRLFKKQKASEKPRKRMVELVRELLAFHYQGGLSEEQAQVFMSRSCEALSIRQQIEERTEVVACSKPFVLSSLNDGGAQSPEARLRYRFSSAMTLTRASAQKQVLPLRLSDDLDLKVERFINQIVLLVLNKAEEEERAHLYAKVLMLLTQEKANLNAKLGVVRPMPEKKKHKELVGAEMEEEEGSAMEKRARQMNPNDGRTGHFETACGSAFEKKVKA
jgi:hypothetical protein